MAQDAVATTTKKTFSRQTTVSTTINAPVAKIWSLLTDAANYPTWNTTVVSIDGTIAQGQTIHLKSTLDPKRSFKLKISEFAPPQTLVWGDALGKRTYTIAEQNGAGCLFTMSEKIGGPVFPLFASKIPSFDASFEQFARDLKQAAEKN